MKNVKKSILGREVQKPGGESLVFTGNCCQCDWKIVSKGENTQGEVEDIRIINTIHLLHYRIEPPPLSNYQFSVFRGVQEGILSSREFTE